MMDVVSSVSTAMRRGMARLFGIGGAFLFSLALAGCGGGGSGGGGFLGDVDEGVGGGAGVVLGSGAGLSEERRRVVAAKVAGLDLGGKGGEVGEEDVRVSDDPAILNRNPFAVAEAESALESAPVAVAEGRGFARQSVRLSEERAPGYKAFEVAVPSGSPLMTVAVWISEAAPEEEGEERKFLRVRMQVYVSAGNFAAVEGGEMEVLETTEVVVEERLPAPKPLMEKCEGAWWETAWVDDDVIQCQIPLTSGGRDFDGCVLAGDAAPLCSEVFGSDLAFPRNWGGRSPARYVFNCGAGMMPEGANESGATECLKPSFGECEVGWLGSGGATQVELNAALRLAARRGSSAEICEALWRGAEVDGLGGAGFTALQEAASGGRLEVARMLLLNGADVNGRKEGAGPSALDLAARGENAEVAAALREAGGWCFEERGTLCGDAGADASCPAGSLPANGMTQAELDTELKRAAYYRDLDKACEYLRRGANVGGQFGTEYPFSDTPLYYAVWSFALWGKSLDVAKLLIAHGANVNAERNRGLPLLHWAVSWGSTEVASLLLANGADVNGSGNFYEPLLLAASEGDLEMAKLLLDSGADVGGRHGQTAMHRAVVGRRNNIEMARLLLEYGADVNAEIVSGNTPLHDAAVGYRLFYEMAELLIANGANVHAKNGLGNTPLHLAAQTSSRSPREVAELLIANGADVNATGLRGDTPLHFATDNHMETMRLLVAHGADVNAKGHYGRSPLFRVLVAGIFEEAEGIEKAELLLAHGADVNVREHYGKGGSLLDRVARYYDDATEDDATEYETKLAAVLREAGGKCFLPPRPLCGESVAMASVEYSSSANGTVSADVESGGEVAWGTMVSFAAMPAEGWRVSEWTGSCAGVGAVSGQFGRGGEVLRCAGGRGFERGGGFFGGSVFGGSELSVGFASWERDDARVVEFAFASGGAQRERGADMRNAAARCGGE